MKNMQMFNHWRKVDKINVFTPRSVKDVKSGKQNQPHVSTDCASCGSGCSGGGCSGAGCGV